MEKKRFWKLWLPSFLFLGLVVIVIIIGWFCCCHPITTILLVRHAEKTMQGTDPPLSDEGQARAQTLAHVTGEAGVTAIYTSQYLRTQQTVQEKSTRKILGSGDLFTRNSKLNTESLQWENDLETAVRSLFAVSALKSPRRRPYSKTL